MGPGRVVQRPPAVARAAASLAYVLACLLLWCGGIVWGYVSSCESESTAPIAPPRVHPINRRTNRRVDAMHVPPNRSRRWGLFGRARVPILVRHIWSEQTSAKKQKKERAIFKSSRAKAGS